MANRQMLRNKSPAVAVGRRIAFSGSTQHAWHDSGRTRVDADQDFEDDNVSEVDSDTEKSLMCEPASSTCPEDADPETQRMSFMSQQRMSFMSQQRMSFMSTTSQQRMSFMSTASAASVAPDIKRVGTAVAAKGNAKAAANFGANESNVSSFSTAASGSVAVAEDLYLERTTFEEPEYAEFFGRSMGKVPSLNSSDDSMRECPGRSVVKAPSAPSQKSSSSGGSCPMQRQAPPTIPSSNAVVARPASLLRSGRTAAGGLPDNECLNECLDEFVTEYECRQQFSPSPSARAGAMSKPPLSLLPTTSRPGSTEPHTFPARGMDFCTAKVLVRGITTSSNAAASPATRAPEKSPFRGAASPFEFRQPFDGPRCHPARQTFAGASSDAFRPAWQSFTGAHCDPARQTVTGASGDAGAKCASIFPGAGMPLEPGAQDSVPRAESLSPASARVAALALGGTPDIPGAQNFFANSEQPDQRAPTRVLATAVPTVPSTRRTTTNPFRRTPPGGRSSH